MRQPPIGVLLVNLGSPAAPTAPAVRAYLRQFLSDRRVVDVPRLLWWPLLRGVILPLRAPRSAALYRRVWTEDGPPLVSISRRQARLLGERLGPGFAVACAMRYGQPSLDAGLADLLARGAARLIVLPMFPQYAEATIGSIRAELPAALARVARARRRLAARAGRDDAPPRAGTDALAITGSGARPGAGTSPGASGDGFSDVRVVDPFPTAPGYIEALAARLTERAALDDVDHVVFSFHGLPQKAVDRGDPYRTQCEATARALAERLALPPRRWTLVFQSRFGRAPWLQPYADVLVPALAASAPRVLVSCPGFTADCLETVDEIGHVLAGSFRAAGGRELLLAEGLNEHPLWIGALERLVRERAGQPAPAGAHAA